MKIISKRGQKDYYDYLAGQYGIDEKLVLDRTEFTPMPYSPDHLSVVTFYICGWVYQGIYWNPDNTKGRFIYGKEIEPYTIDQSRDKYKWWTNPDQYYIIKHTNPRLRSVNVLREPRKLQSPTPNDKLNCPILIAVRDEVYDKFPVLSEYDFHKVLSPHDIWIMLSEWLGREIPTEDKRTDQEKVKSSGFDLKSSFRNIK